jgi:hypothetical protein
MKKYLFLFDVWDRDNNPHIAGICAHTQAEAESVLLTLLTLEDYDEEVTVLEVIQSMPLGLVTNN